MKIPDDLRYTLNDEWIRVQGDSAEVGISDHAQDQLSDIVYLEIHPATGDALKAGAPFAAVESVKAAADVYMPVDGEILEGNDTLKEAPEKINSDPYGEAWIIKIKLADPSQVEGLMDAAAYKKHIEEREA
jgi:glycine cleavage system H protein